MVLQGLDYDWESVEKDSTIGWPHATEIRSGARRS